MGMEACRDFRTGAAAEEKWLLVRVHFFYCQEHCRVKKSICGKDLLAVLPKAVGSGIVAYVASGFEQYACACCDIPRLDERFEIDV